MTITDASTMLRQYDDISASKLSTFPIAWSTPAVGNGHNLDDLSLQLIDNKIGKSPEQIATCSVQIRCTTFRSSLNVRHGHVEFRQKPRRCDGASFSVPVVSGLCFIARRGMELERQSDYPAFLVSRRRTSAHGTGVTAPLSNSSKRRAISSLQAA